MRCEKLEVRCEKWEVGEIFACRGKKDGIFDSKTSSKIFSIRRTIGEFPFSDRKKILYSGKNLKKKALYQLSYLNYFLFFISHFNVIFTCDF